MGNSTLKEDRRYAESVAKQFLQNLHHTVNLLDDAESFTSLLHGASDGLREGRIMKHLQEEADWFLKDFTTTKMMRLVLALPVINNEHKTNIGHAIFEANACQIDGYKDIHVCSGEDYIRYCGKLALLAICYDLCFAKHVVSLR